MPTETTRSDLLGTSQDLHIPDRAAAARAGWLDRWLARRLQRAVAPARVRVGLWDGTAADGAPEEALGTLVVGDRAALIALLLDPDLQFGETYMDGRLEILGPFEPVLEALTALEPLGRSRAAELRAAFEGRNTRRRARLNVHHHYDIGNSFYEQWLDADLVYTCAYYARPEMSLDEAQRAKLDLVCRKLRLQPGETVVEAGCGWGALALHMARAYGVRVKAFNLSREQMAYARDRARREGLADRVEFIEDDYRNIAGQFDAFVSVGMLEHVGPAQFQEMAAVVERSIRRHGGRGLLHFIGRDIRRPLNAWIRRRIFPGAYPPTLAEVAARILEPAGMSVLDVENLRLHYARTCGDWYRRFQSAADRMRALYGDAFTRAWGLYLAGSRAAFATGWLQLFQVVFAPRESAPPYWTRAAIYGHEGEGSWSAATR